MHARRALSGKACPDHLKACPNLAHLPGRRESIRERWRNEGGEVKVGARPDPVHPRAQIIMVRVRGGHCERSPQPRVGALALEERVSHGDLGRE
eukprot:6211809-Pleurochrysis_carterae.AAC.2